MNDRWEHGSEFHWDAWDPDLSNPGRESQEWEENSVLFGSGRDALRGLLTHGRRFRKWQCIWLPDFFCQKVIQSILDTGIRIKIYPDSPISQPDFSQIPVIPGDVILVVNYFGLRAGADYSGIDRNLLEVIEDHTHDPWSKWAIDSQADWCIASLRKTLPLAEGGMLWSPFGHELPVEPPCTKERSRAAAYKLEAMILKGMYLTGHQVEKENFRALALAGEERIASGEISGITPFTKSLLNTFPIFEWRKRRAENYRTASIRINNLPGVHVLQGEDGTCPFSLFLIFDDKETRDSVRTFLVSNRIYPAILWPLEGSPDSMVLPGHVDLSRRALSLHCDMRYNEADMNRVVETLTLALNERFKTACVY